MIIFWNSLMLSYILILVWLKMCHSTPWATREQEAQDEKNDVAILKAVFTSMEEYWLRRLTSGHRKKRADSVVCYGNLGCFEDTGPFSYIDMLPSSPEEVSTKFQLYFKNDRGDIPSMEVPYSNMSDLLTWASKTLNTSNLMKIIVHGFGSSCNHVWIYEMRSALMSVEDCNVICVDWEAGALIPNYVRAVANTRLVGKQLALLIKGFLNQGLTLDKVHLIGFSLGAHVAGFAGAELKNVSRITGLDPAGPLFESQDPKVRLDETDAVFVDVIHSNGENLILGGLGSWQPMGHVDFYPNGGRMQKGCTNLFVGAVSDIIWSASDIEGRSLCNHRRAYKFFTDSVSPRCHFPAFPCESYEKFIDGKCFPCSTKKECGNMGYYADKSSARGSLYLITREEEPFCAHQYHVKVESSPNDVPIYSYGKIQVTLIGENYINETFTLTKKDDEELGVGTSLSRIMVPHPALEPLAIEILYIAYSGWITSGLKKWSIDKVKLSDSYGKSMSHCKKDLVLESKIPVTMKLFPGDCNLPKEPQVTTTENIDPFFVTESKKKLENTTTSTPKSSVDNAAQGTNKTNLIIDGFPAYVSDKDYYEVVGNDSESSETNKIIIDAIVPKISSRDSENNYEIKIVRKQEITEPVLQPKSIGRNLKGEIDEPVLKAIEKVEIVQKIKTTISPIELSEKFSLKPKGIELEVYTYEPTQKNLKKVEDSKEWNLSREMHPPPLGWQGFWDSVREPKTIDNLQPSNIPAKKQKFIGSGPMTLQSQVTRKNKIKTLDSKSLKNFYVSSSSQKSWGNHPRNEDGSITVQLLPQYLVSILRQAEQYAKINFLGSLEIFNKSPQYKGSPLHSTKRDGRPEDRSYLEDLAVPREMETGSINFFPRVYGYIEKGLESVKSFFGILHWREDDVKADGIKNRSASNVDAVLKNSVSTIENVEISVISLGNDTERQVEGKIKKEGESEMKKFD